MTGYVPAYRVIINSIRQSVKTGQLKAGDKLPSLPELTEQFDCSTGTVRRALEHLMVAGIVEGRQGVGYFITGKMPDE
ncbi:winged helix-turn-helix domain-containing protein [Micromonospora globbae]|uniref:GntR family transcriptional regulator n=1 Tax=Micromonospora globbae TaxID=1894969 RepID=A0A420F1J7_9ACTN|nr:winged helix-turn-helix domain-containing protein [Micromonospora globbae]RKF26853.1 GntR family transcriptional regulator [Micromonospora globbae]WTF88792.1 winged helix-turn-helix domain-containing protein [Micromonospora globbae]